MFPTDEELCERLKNLSESFGVEVKSWIDPGSLEGKEKIIKAAIALRNNDGGILVIGFSNDTMRPAPERPSNIRAMYHQDEIQSLVTKYASESFEVAVRFVMYQDDEFPVICVPRGLRVPVAAKHGLEDPERDGAKRHRIRIHDIYVRSLESNNSVSTTTVKWQDLKRLMEHCFENQEADFGRFLRRHLASGDIVKLKDLLISATQDTTSALVNEAVKLLDSGRSRFTNALYDRQLGPPAIGYFEFAAVLQGKIRPLRPNQEFLNLIGASNRKLTGWPSFVSLTAAQVEDRRPFHYQGGWEQLVYIMDRNSDSFFFPNYVDFWRIEPGGRFYLLQGFDDDLRSQHQNMEPGTSLEFRLPMWRTGDAIIEAMALSRNMVEDSDSASLYVALRWSKLKQRTLTAWADQFNSWCTPRVSNQDEATSCISIPLVTADSAVFQYVHKALLPLYEAFGGMTLDSGVVEGELRKLLKLSS